MKLPDIPILAFYILSAIGLVVASRFRLSALLAAGATQPGHKRLVRTAWLLLWDTVTFASVGFLLRLDVFPLFMAGLLVFGVTAGLLALQWFFKRTPKAPGSPAGPIPSIGSVGDGVQNLQNVALGLGYTRAEEWVKSEYHKNQWRIGLGYQGVTIGLCMALRVLDALQGGWLYILFSLLWQGGVTGFLHWKFDRKRPAAPSPGSVSPSPSKDPRLPGGPPHNAAAPPTRTPFYRLPPNAPGTRPPGTPGGAGIPPSNAATHRSPGKAPGSAPAPRRRKFATRSDVQAFVALSAGFWCGLFDRLFGWWYGFTSVMAFRSILSLGAPLLTGMLSRYAPPQLQAFLNVKPKKSLLSIEYFKSREFWYGPGMGVLGGIAGALVRWVLFNR